MTRPVVALEAQRGDDAGTHMMTDDYVGMLERFGLSVAIVSPCLSAESVEAVVGLCDGVVVPGGNDIDGTLYGADVSAPHEEYVFERDVCESRLLWLSSRLRLPYLGICRGMQMLNVFRGGTLRDVGETCVRHEGTGGGFVTHDVTWSLGNEVREFAVVGAHHQCVGRLGKDLRVVACASDGVVEAVLGEGGTFAGGVQWHPERSEVADGAVRMVALFAEACRERHVVGVDIESGFLSAFSPWRQGIDCCVHSSPIASRPRTTCDT